MVQAPQNLERSSCNFQHRQYKRTLFTSAAERTPSSPSMLRGGVLPTRSKWHESTCPLRAALRLHRRIAFACAPYRACAFALPTPALLHRTRRRSRHQPVASASESSLTPSHPIPVASCSKTRSAGLIRVSQWASSVGRVVGHHCDTELLRGSEHAGLHWH